MFGPRLDDPRVIFAVEVGERIHPSDSWRLGRPSYEFRQRGYDVHLTAAKRGTFIPTLAPDVLVIARQTPNPKQFEQFVWAMHELGCAVLLDWDDTPNFHPTFHRATEWQRRASDAWKCVRLADGVTATTPALVEHLRAGGAKRAYWTPNLIPIEQWRRPPGKEYRPDALTVGVMGSQSHSADWQDVLPQLWGRLADAYPQLHFCLIGGMPPWFGNLIPSDRLHVVSWSGIEEYPHYVRWIDIGLAPLQDTEFNRMKSPIKWMEYTLAGAAVVASDVMYSTWITNAGTGLLAHTLDDWYNQTCWLIDHPEYRTYLIDQARAEVLAWHTFSDERLRAWMNVYADVYREVFNGRLPDESQRSARADVAWLLTGQRSEHALLVRANGTGG